MRSVLNGDENKIFGQIQINNRLKSENVWVDVLHDSYMKRVKKGKEKLTATSVSTNGTYCVFFFVTAKTTANMPTTGKKTQR